MNGFQQKAPSGSLALQNKTVSRAARTYKMKQSPKILDDFAVPEPENSIGEIYV
ncbi:MAG: hypothetical protein ACYC2R_14840 [Burkholderiales bacterium]